MDEYCKYCGTDINDVGGEEDWEGDMVCDECIYSMSDEEYGIIISGEGGGFHMESRIAEPVQ